MVKHFIIILLCSCLIITHNGLNLMQKFLEGVSMCFLTRLKMAVLLAKFLWGRGGGGLWAETKLGSSRSIPSHLED